MYCVVVCAAPSSLSLHGAGCPVMLNASTKHAGPQVGAMYGAGVGHFLSTNSHQILRKIMNLSFEGCELSTCVPV